ncbi:hypothetical protein [Streptomyces rishiriensis]|uniref:hypothetical protein n=1 Tax=Streptomyces rishiriensis TaxID=68264 RepID=UPI0027D8A846|nr:hypothetical protein [Streptomyces rishiriensis]
MEEIGTQPHPIGDASTGAKLTACDGAGSNSYWDGVHLLGADTLTMNGRKVGYRSDHSCPPKRPPRWRSGHLPAAGKGPRQGRGGG